MNKILLVLMLLITVIGGGYFLLPQEKVNQFVKYLPLPFSELLSKDDISVVREEQTPVTPTKMASPEVLNPINKKAAIEQEVFFKTEDQTELETKVETKVAKNKIDTPEVEKSVENKNIDTISQQLELARIFEGDSAEVIKVKKKIQKVLERMNEFDGTSGALKARFDKIIQENRNVTLKLKKINDQIEETH